MGLIGEETDGAYRSYHFDYRGSTVVLTDEPGNVVERFQYSPYGLLLSSNSSVTPFLFNGMYGAMTSDNGLYYMCARFYSPEIKRFINQDILLGNVAEGQTLNRFAYVTGNSVSFMDPFVLYAIVIVDREGAGGQGHSAIVIQNRETGQLVSFSFGPTQPPQADTILGTIELISDTAYPGAVGHSFHPESSFSEIS